MVESLVNERHLSLHEGSFLVAAVVNDHHNGYNVSSLLDENECRAFSSRHVFLRLRFLANQTINT